MSITMGETLQARAKQPPSLFYKGESLKCVDDGFTAKPVNVYDTVYIDPLSIEAIEKHDDEHCTVQLSNGRYILKETAERMMRIVESHRRNLEW